ncbi:MAG TPA: response regulator [Patescibacteria group bacterium]|nr:response regulator [Patescibacteria group bacterium]
MRDRSPGVGTPLILIADDNVDTREMYSLYLNMVGYRVETAEDGHQAIIKARALHPDLIVMDLQMPKLDGWAAIRELQARAETATIPVVVLTGHDFKAYLKPAALAVGACSFLMKPCFPDQLAREVSDRLGMRRKSAASAL